jgi:WD40 repeat protein/tetratricopeptide (TPR) repeat protein
MNARNEKIEEIFEQALGLNSEAERSDYLAHACPDPVMRREVESLLKAHHNADTVLKEETIAVPAVPTEGPGSRIGRYKLLQQIGEGGMGVVYMAEQEEPVRRRVALKIIKLGMDTRNVVARFEAERQALALMDHPNIARVLDGGSTETGRPYFVMELVQGVPITEYCNKAKIPARERLELFIQVCQAIQSAHQKGIIHRDIKPSNVLVTLHDGVPVPKVIDFGIAKATNQKLTEKTLFTNFATMIGTPAYMSPEQAELSGLDIDTRTDIYALGVLLYELLTGSTPFPEKRLRSLGYGEMQRVIMEEEPERPSTRLSTLTEEQKTILSKNCGEQIESLRNLLRGDLDWIVMRCLEKDRTRRYETANGLASDLKRHLNNEPVVARPPSAVYKLQKAIRRNKLAFASASTVLSALVIGIVVCAWQVRVASIARKRETEANKELRAQIAETQSAKKSADRAAQSESEQRMRIAGMLETMQFQKAEDLLAGQESSLGVAHLVAMLRANPSNEVAAARLTSAILRPFAKPLADPIMHENPVEYAQFSPNGARVVTISGNKTRVCDGGTGQTVCELSGHERPVKAAVFSPDSSRIVTTSDDETARIWDARTGQLLGKPMRHEATIVSAQFSPDGLKIVTASEDNTARIWDARTGLALTPALTNSTGVVLGQFVADGTQIFTVSLNGTITLWDSSSGRTLARPPQTAGWLAWAQFSPDGLQLVTSVCNSLVRVSNSHDYTAHVWNTHTGQPVGQPLRHDNFVICARFSPDGSRIVTASLDNTARVWDASTGLPLTEPMRHDNWVRDAEFSPDGLKVVTASGDKTARVWDTRTGLALTEPLLHLGEVRSAGFSPDGALVVTASEDKTVRLWNIRAWPPLPKLLRHEQALNWAEFSPDGSKVVTASQDKTARLWDSRSGAPLNDPLRHEGEVTYAQFSPDGSKVVTASADKTARMWDARTGLPLNQPLQHKDRVTWAQFSPDSQRLVTTSYDQTAQVWNALTGLAAGGPLRHQDGVGYAQFSADGSKIATVSGDKSVRLWDARTGLLAIEPLRHEARVFDAEFSPDGLWLVTASGNNTARMWDLRTGQPLGNPLRHDAEVYSAQLSPDGQRVVTASADKTARIWDTRTGQEVGAPLRHEAGVNDAEFSRDGLRVVTASRDKTVRVWDARTGLPLTEPLRHNDQVLDAQFSRDGLQVVTASVDKSARIWEVPPIAVPVPSWFLDWAEARVGRRLDQQGGDHSILTAEQRQQQDLVRARTDTNFFARIAQWAEADPLNRTLSPTSSLNTTEYAKRLIEENTDASSQAALQLIPNASLAWALQALTISHRMAETTHSTADPPLLQSDSESVVSARQIIKDNQAAGNEIDILLTRAGWLARHSLDLDSSQPTAWRALATVQWLTNSPAEALASLQRGLVLQSNSPQILELQGDILEHEGRHAEALEAYDRWFRLLPATDKVPGCPRMQALDKHAAICRKLGRWNDAVADIRAGGVPARDPAAEPGSIDLSAFYNLEFGDDISTMPTGILTIEGTRFDVRGSLFLASGTHCPNRVPSEMPNIPVAAKGRRIRFLHAAYDVADPIGTTIGTYVLHFADGGVLEKPIILGRDILDTAAEPPAASIDNPKLALTFQGHSDSGQKAKAFHLYLTTLDNPHPEIAIASLDFSSSRQAAAPFLVAVTVE